MRHAGDVWGGVIRSRSGLPLAGKRVAHRETGRLLLLTGAAADGWWRRRCFPISIILSANTFNANNESNIDFSILGNVNQLSPDTFLIINITSPRIGWRESVRMGRRFEDYVLVLGSMPANMIPFTHTVRPKKLNHQRISTEKLIDGKHQRQWIDK